MVVVYLGAAQSLEVMAVETNSVVGKYRRHTAVYQNSTTALNDSLLEM